MFPGDERTFIGHNFLINNKQIYNLFYIRDNDTIEPFYLDEEIFDLQEEWHQCLFYAAFEEEYHKSLEEYLEESQKAHQIRMSQFMEKLESRPQKVFNKDINK